MGIKELYLKYLNLKEEKLDNKEIEYNLYKELINYKDISDEGAESLEYIDKSKIISYPSLDNYEDQEEWMNARNCWKNFRIMSTNSFTQVSFMTKVFSERTYVKFYLEIPDELRKKFVIDYGKFVYNNLIRGTYKIRNSAHSNDMLTVRVYNPKNYEKAYNFLSNYVAENTTYHEFMPSINGIGITLDDDGSYNKYIIDNLLNYFEVCNNENDVSYVNFLKYINDRKNVYKLDWSSRDSSYIYSLNLLYAFDKNLTSSKIFERILKSQQEMKNSPFTSENVAYTNRELDDLIEKISFYGIDNISEYINKFLNKTYDCNRTRCEDIIKFYLGKSENYVDSENVTDYLTRELTIYNNNMAKMCELFDRVFNETGIEGIKKLVIDINNINDPSEYYNYGLEKINIHYCNIDELHPFDGVKPISMNNLYLALLKFYGNEKENSYSSIENIINLFEEKLNQSSKKNPTRSRKKKN